MNVFIQHDEDYLVTGVLHSPNEEEADFIRLTKPLPPTEDNLLSYNPKDGSVFYIPKPPTLEEETKLLKEENEQLKSSVANLEDMLVILTMP